MPNVRSETSASAVMSSTVTVSRPRSTASRSAAEPSACRTAGLRSSPYAGPLQAFLAEASQRVRPVFHGPLTYASIPFEVVDRSCGLSGHAAFETFPC